MSSPARSLRARSLVTEDGSELDVDVVVCATGYAAADYLGQIDVVGEGGDVTAGDVARRRVRVSRHGRAGLPELLHAVRAEHQRRVPTA